MNSQGFSSVDHAWTQFQNLQAAPHKDLLAKIEEEIKKSIDPTKAGYQSPTSQGSAGALWPLIPEDLDSLVSQVDFKASHLGFFDWLPKGTAKQTLVQYMRWLSHGLEHMDNATVEGAIAIQNTGAYGRGNGSQAAVKMKQYTETRSITDMLAAVSLAGQPAVPQDALAFWTSEAMLSLHRCIERDSLFGDSAVAPAKIDGVIPQLKAAGQFQNLDGAQLTMETLEDLTRDLQSAPFYGSPTDIFVTPKVFTSLSRQQVAMARREMNSAGISYGFGDDGLKIKVGISELTVKPLVFLDERKQIPPGAKANDGTDIADPVVANNDRATIAANAAGSKFAAGDAGFYSYIIVGFGPHGYTAPFTVPSTAPKSWIQVAAADSVTFTAAAAGGNDVTYYKVFRTKAFATSAELETACGIGNGGAGQATNFKPYQFLCSIAAQNANNGAAIAATFVDKNLERTDCGKTLILRKDPAEVELYQLIKLMRLPLARNGASQPFFLLTALGLALKVPEHAMLLTNCAPPS